jgi:hypothetical protein
MTLINMSPTDLLRSGAFLTLTRRDELEAELRAVETYIRLAQEHPSKIFPESLAQKQARRDEIVKELEELENGKDINA